ncbi:hypothetical protein AXK12_00715 [Cephaloticoccus capnophilus]|uniref:Probable nicotinate-nucleotide adenylyltransferase n=1 Tax=Cephaloticoccus capnophilus TaxID=1548208 RepID=A0A139SU20_9BACT|nr:nicotinate-nucleotide adenylyltransferase [Cephaloticoccus capnophilus]KXU38073.1 hypothetical protein AXK12_00715 [Cephaloticoccus capnophilus]
MKIGLYGGSFDPVHFGHLIVAQEAYERFGLDRVIFIPAAQSPRKPDTASASAEDRLAMVQAATQDDPRFAVSDIELRRGGVSYTLDTVRELKSRTPSDTFYWIIGADQAARLPEWHAIVQLAQLVEFIAVERPGSPALAPASVPGLRVQRLESRLIDISSTQLRERARRGLPLEYFIPHKALVYLKAHCLYREN